MNILQLSRILFHITLFASSLGFLLFGFLNPERIRFLWSSTTLIILLILISLWCFYVYQCWKESGKPILESVKPLWKGIFVALFFTIVVASSVETGYRVLSDETNLIAVSKSIFTHKTIENVTMGKWFYNEFHPLIQEIPKRPPLFSLLVSFLHLILGYHTTNGFVLNKLVFFILLLLIYNIFNYFANAQSGLASVLLIVAQPIVTLCATCAGFDLFAATFLIGTLMITHNYISDPTATKFEILWISLAILAYTRYEFILVSGLIIIFLCVFKYFKLRHIQHRYFLYSLTPCFYIPLLWQQALCRNSYAEGSDYLFRIEDFVPHLDEMLKAQMKINSNLPYLPLANWVGIEAFLLIILSIICKLIVNVLESRKNDELLNNSRRARFSIAKLFTKGLDTDKTGKLIEIFILITIIVFTLTSLYLTHYFGHYAHPASARFFIIIIIFLSITPLLSNVFTGFFPSYLILGYATCMFFIGHPIAVNNSFFKTLEEPRKDIYVQDFLKAKDTKDFLLITSRPGQYTIDNYGAVDFHYANDHAGELINELSRHLYNEIFVVQNVEYETDRPIQADLLEQRFKLLEIESRQITATQYIRFSRVL